MANPRAYLDQVKGQLGGAIYNCLAGLFKRVETLETQATDIGTVDKPLTADLNAGSHKVTALADPTNGTDAVNLQTMQKYVDAALRQKGV